jgi:hypothetical protein
VVSYVSEHPHGATLYFWVHAWNGTDWPLLGRAPELGNFVGPSPRWPSLTVDPTGSPWVSFPYLGGRWPDLYTSTDVKRWDGTAWVYAPHYYLAEGSRRPPLFVRAGAKALFGAGRSPRGLRASVRVEMQ